MTMLEECYHEVESHMLNLDVEIMNKGALAYCLLFSGLVADSYIYRIEEEMSCIDEEEDNFDD